MKPFRSPCALASLALSIALSLTGAAAASTLRNVTNVAPGHVAWLHRTPSVASPRVGYLEAGALRVRTTMCKRLAKGGWCQVMRRGTRGWVQDRFLMPDRLMRS